MTNKEEVCSRVVLMEKLVGSEELIGIDQPLLACSSVKVQTGMYLNGRSWQC